MNSSVDISSFLPFLGVLFGGGVGVALVAQLFKKIFKLNGPHVIHIMVITISALAAAAQYILQSKNLPTDILGISTPVIYGVSQFVYKESGYINSFLSRVYGGTSTVVSPTTTSASVGSVVVDDRAAIASQAPKSEFSL